VVSLVSAKEHPLQNYLQSSRKREARYDVLGIFRVLFEFIPNEFNRWNSSLHHRVRMRWFTDANIVNCASRHSHRSPGCVAASIGQINASDRRQCAFNLAWHSPLLVARALAVAQRCNSVGLVTRFRETHRTLSPRTASVVLEKGRFVRARRINSSLKVPLGTPEDFIIVWRTRVSEVLINSRRVTRSTNLVALIAAAEARYENQFSQKWKIERWDASR